MDPLDPFLDVVVANRYRIERKLGEGGMSAVYEAKHVKLHRSFAIKVLLPTLIDNEEAVKRFEREAEMLSGLNHPNVVEITDWDYLPDGTPAMVLEYLHGATMRVRLSRGALPWDVIGKLGDQVMSALTLAHRNGITHRDLKPDNIFIAIDDVGEEHAKLLDFGVSKLRGVGTMTGVFNMLGTPGYMSPEQASGRSDEVGPATDVWAMGAILYELATGRAAFQGESLADTLMRITSRPPDPIAAFRNDAPPLFVDLVARAMSLDPAKRIMDIESLRAGLREALDPRNSMRTLTPPAGSIPLTGMMPAPKPHTRELARMAMATPNNPMIATGTTRAVPPRWSRRRLLWIFGIAAILITGGAAAIVLAL